MRTLVAVAAIAAAVPVGSAAAATLTVTTTADGTPASGCTLREAIAAVDAPGTTVGGCPSAAFGPNTISLAAGTYTLNDAAASTLEVGATVSGLQITGAGEGSTTIDATGLGDRAFTVDAGATVGISDLTITHSDAQSGTLGAPGPAGDAGSTGGRGGSGGAILSAGTLSLTDVAITDSAAGNGGAGGSGGIGLGVPGGQGGNGGGGGSGGAIDNSLGTLTLTGVTLSGNVAGAGGDGGSGGAGTSGGEAGAAGGGGAGGAVDNDQGTLTVSASTIDGNGAGAGGLGGTGGAATAQGGGGGSGGSGGFGGGIVSSTGGLTVTNTTLAANDAGNAGDGGDGGDAQSGGTSGLFGYRSGGGSGGAIWTSSAAGSLQSVTIAGNDVGSVSENGSDGTGGSNPGTPIGPLINLAVGGGVDGQHPVTVQASIFASNSGGNCGGTITDSGDNISFGSGDASCPATFAAGNPELGALQNNGGPAPTIDLGAGSAAINSVPAGAACPASDERGAPRPSGAACDAGAYEVTPPVVGAITASALTDSSATLTAAVTPFAGAATIQFKYGTSTQYGSTTPAATIGGVISQPQTGTLTGLAAGTTYHAIVTVTAPDGTVSSADATFTTVGTTATSPPVIRGLKLKPARFAAAKRGSPTAASKKGGTTVSYTDSQKTTTTFVVTRPEAGIRAGKRCIAPPKHRRGHPKRCTRYVAVGRFSHADVAGANRLHFTGRIGGHALKKGRYRLTATPKGGKPVTVSFTIKA
jgi:CSLREA domain-containing protein